MVLAGKMFWSLPRIAATNRWCPVQKDGLQPRILVMEEILHLAMATWHSSLPLMVVKDFKEMTVGTEETEEITEIAQIKEIGLMVAEQTSTRMPEEVGVAKVENPEILLVFLPRLDNSLLLT